MRPEYNIVLVEKPLDEGLIAEECAKMFSLLSSTQAVPIEVQAEHSVAMGFVSLADEELMGYDLDPLADFIRNILNDMNNESTTGEYIFPHSDKERHSVSYILLTRNLLS